MASVTIPSGATESNAFIIGGDFRLAGLQISPGWDAAGLTFKVSADGVIGYDFAYMHDGGVGAGTLIAIPSGAIAANRPIVFIDQLLAAAAAWRAVKLVASATQTADRVISLLLDGR